jgi:tetratricopeptide (TPR) repeat protein
METVRKVYILGSDQGQDELESGLKTISYLQVIRSVDPPDELMGIYFVIGALDFNNPRELQMVAKVMDQTDSPLCQKIGYFFQPESPSMMQVLFAVELGSRLQARGQDRLEQVRKFIQASTSFSGKLSDLQRCQQEMRRVYALGDLRALTKLGEEVGEIGRDSEEGLRLQVEIQQRLGKIQRVEALLRKILMKYPENLWAANQLGKVLLRRGQAGQAIEVLSKLSFFHDLNGERHLALGEAFAECGQGREAEASFAKAAKLQVDPERVNQGMIKAKLVQGDMAGADLLCKPGDFNLDVVSFLNMRAILSAKLGHFDAAGKLYHFALAKSTSDEVTQAKLYFNLGLNSVKAKDYKAAIEHLEKSKKLGGAFFERATKPLEAVRKLSTSAKASSKDLEDALVFEEIE